MSAPDEPRPPGADPTPFPPEPDRGSVAELAVGGIGGLLLGLAFALLSLFVLGRVGSGVSTLAIAIAVAELAIAVLLIRRVARRPPHRFVAGLAVGFAVALLLSSLCWGLIGFAK